MPKPIDTDMLKKNPQVDLGKLEESQKLRDNIRRGGGIRGPKTGPVFHRKRARVIDDVSSDKRVVRLPVKVARYLSESNLHAAVKRARRWLRGAMILHEGCPHA